TVGMDGHTIPRLAAAGQPTPIPSPPWGEGRVRGGGANALEVRFGERAMDPHPDPLPGREREKSGGFGRLWYDPLRDETYKALGRRAGRDRAGPPRRRCACG